MTKITHPDKVAGDTYSGAEATEVKTVVNANDDAATLNVEAWSLSIRADKKRTHSTPETMSGDMTLTWDATGAVAGMGETKMIIGDGNDVIISGATLFPDNGTTFPTESGKEYLFVFIWQDTYLQMDINPEITPSGWTPADLGADLMLWLDATVGVTETGTGVSEWADQSGNNRDFVQGTDGQRPTYNTDEILFTSANSDVLEIVGSSSAAWVKSFHDGTLAAYDICVKAHQTTDANGVFIGDNAGSGVARGFWAGLISTDKVLRTVIGEGVGKCLENISDNDYWTVGTTYQWYRITNKPNEGTPANRSTVYNESASSANNTETGTPNVLDAVQDIQIGAAGNDVLLLNGGIKEIIICKRELTSQEWTNIKAR